MVDPVALEEEEKGLSSDAWTESGIESAFMKSVSDSSGRRTVWSRVELREMHARIVNAPCEADRITARHELACTALRYMVKLAKQYRSRTSRHLGMVDLYSIGYLGLFRATEDYDPDHGAFTTYATAWVHQHIRRAFMNDGRTVRVPVQRMQKAFSFVRTWDELRNRFGREPLVGEVAAALDLDIDTLEKFRVLMELPVALDAPMRGDDGEADETYVTGLTGEDNSLDPDVQMEGAEISAALWARLECLTPREREVIVLRYGLEGEEPLTLKDTAEIFDLTRERIRQIEVGALKKLRRWIGDDKEAFL